MILVIGGAGYVGSHIVRALVGAGAEVAVLDDLSTGHRRLVPDGVPLFEGAVEDEARLGEVLRGVDAIVHCAARSLVGESIRDPKLYFEANCGGALGLARAMLAHGVRDIVFSSTAAVYGVPAAVPIDDDHPRAPINPYGTTKAFVEDLFAAYAAHGLRAVSLRYFNAAGADPSAACGELHANETHLIPLLLDAALGRGAASVFGSDYPTRDGTCLRDFVHVTDLADAHVRAIDHLRGGGAPLRANLGSGLGHTVREVIASVERVTGRPLRVIDGPRRAGDPPALVAGAETARRVLGWQPARTALDTIVEDAWRWHRRVRG